MPPIKKTDIIGNDVKKAFEDINKAMLVTVDYLSKIVVEGNKFQQVFQGSTMASVTAEQKKYNNQQKETITAQKQVIDLQKKEEQLRQSEIRTASAKISLDQKKQRIVDKELKQTAQLSSAYAVQSKRLTELRNKAKDVAITHGTMSKQFKEAARDVSKLNGQLTKIDEKLGQHNRKVGSYTQSIKGATSSLLGALGFVGGLRMAVSAIKDAFTVTARYEKKNAELAAILGKTKDETIALQDASKTLGASTAFTSTKVVDLQISLARLGKTQEEILAMTGGIINATIALGSETGETATLVGATLNSYNMAANKSGHVADVLTLATQRSALSFEKLSTALPVVQGAAAAANVSLEDTVAMLGQASDRGIDASTSATSLRNIFIELSNKGITLDRALLQISSSTDKLKTANDLFGKRAAVTALALAETTGKTKDLSSALKNAGGTAERVAKQQLDTMEGSVTLLKSAYEGLILKLFDTDSTLLSMARTAIDVTTALLGMLSGMEAQNDELSDLDIALRKVTDRYDDENDLLIDTNKSREELIKALESEGFSYKEAKIEADKYLSSLSMINDEMKIQAVNEFTISFLKKEIEQLEALGGSYEAIRAKKKTLLELEDKIKYSKIELKKATDDELTGYVDLISAQYEASDAAAVFLGRVREEIGLRSQLTEEISRGAKTQVRDLSTLAEVTGTTNDLVVETDIKTYQKKKTLAEEVWDAQKKLLLARIESEEKANEKLIEQEEEAAERIKEIRRDLFDQSGEFVNVLFDNKIEKLEDEDEAITASYDARLNNELLSEDQRRQIEAERDQRLNDNERKKRAIEKKQFLIGQAFKAAEIIMDTNVASLKASAQLGVFAPPVITAIRIQGAIALATVLAQSAPKFDKGTKNAPETFWAGEKRPEILKTKKGETMFVDKPTLFSGNEWKGSEITSGAETARLLDSAKSQAIFSNIVDKRKDSGDNAQMLLTLRSIDKSMKKQKRPVVNVRSSQGIESTAWYKKMRN